MSKNKSAKYKITDTDIDKKFIGKQVTVEKVKAKGGPGNDMTPPKKQKSTRDLLIEFMGEQRAFNKQQLEFNTRIEKQVSNLRNDVNTLKTNLNRVIKLNNLKH
ncbi:MAG: hypothetical protein J6Y96_01800 [Mycoplasma sp.]|nr:hypothetical protein [Mycoplasma sp.]